MKSKFLKKLSVCDFRIHDAPSNSVGYSYNYSSYRT